MDNKTLEKKDRVVVRFAGDSGDGMQLTGSRFTDATAVVGNDLATLPDFPAEIRAPAGTPHGVSAFQIHFASRDILTPGDHPNVLVAMNPAALITQLTALEKGGTLIVNEDGFSAHNLRKAGYESNPLEDGSLDDYQVFPVPMTSMTVRATEEIDGITPRDAARCKNLFALGLVSWMYGRPTEPSIDWIEKKFADKRAGARRQPGRLPRGLQLRRDGRAVRGPLRGRAGARAARHLPQRQRDAGARLWADRRQRAARACRSSSPPTRSRRPPSCCTRSRATAASASTRSRPRTRSPPPTWRSAPPSPAASA